MINVKDIHIGSLLLTNRGETIKVESITTKTQHRKVGYHPEGESCWIKYVRLTQCEKIVERELTADMLKANGWNVTYFKSIPDLPYLVSLMKDGWCAEWRNGSSMLNIWTNIGNEEPIDAYPDLSIRVCNTVEKLESAFRILNIDYTLKL